MGGLSSPQRRATRKNCEDQLTEDYRASKRTTIISGVRITQSETNRHQSSSNSEQPNWSVEVDTRTGMFPIDAGALTGRFRSKDAAEEFAARFVVGSEVNDQSEIDQAYPFGGAYSREQFEAHFERGLLARPWKVIAGQDQMATGILQEAGVTGSASGISKATAETLGKDRLERLKTLFKGNWATAAAFEFCWYNLPHSSPAYLAASYQYHRYITGNDFSAGYLWREIEYVTSGIEAEANKALMMRRSAGEKGSKASSSARKMRIAALMEALEVATDKNPDVRKSLGEKALVAIALKDAVQENSKLWSQGQGQSDEYLGEIRRGEAGDALKFRYMKLFPPETA